MSHATAATMKALRLLIQNIPAAERAKVFDAATLGYCRKCGNGIDDCPCTLDQK